MRNKGIERKKIILKSEEINKNEAGNLEIIKLVKIC